MAFPSPSKVAKVQQLMLYVLSCNTITYAELETLIGKLAFLAQCHNLLKLALYDLYNTLCSHTSGRQLPHATNISTHTFASSLAYIYTLLSIHLPGSYKKAI